ncbi:MAG: hypothetical protein AAF206_29410 [Bacteroidota bacterium]
MEDAELAQIYESIGFDCSSALLPPFSIDQDSLLRGLEAESGEKEE